VVAVITIAIYVFGSGLAFFIGSGLLLAAFAMAAARRESRARRFAALAAVLGMVFVTLSAVPWPWWMQGVAAVAVMGWGVCEKVLAGQPFWQKVVRYCVATSWFALTTVEAQYQVVPSIQAPLGSEVWVIGDSVTAGVGDARTVIWPALLADAHAITVHNRWHAGATVGSALKLLQTEPIGDGIILLEIGGNDLLGSTKPANFEARLEQLLMVVSGPGRVVVMFELPLPPHCNEWGIIQRRLAAKHGVQLIPKRVFVGVLTTGGATLDSIHLTQAGHESMAETVWGLLAESYKK
jgi:acyl-CoA thioesterase I